MRSFNTSPGEYYHIYNRGNYKSDIFYEHRDWVRFLFLITHFQAPFAFTNISRIVDVFVQSRALHTDEVLREDITKNRFVELIAFALMPNHFHLLIREKKEKGTSIYMQKVLTAYSKYVNTKYKKSGHVLQGPYRIVHVTDNEQLLYLTSYIHRNPRDLPPWKRKEHIYPWSSYQDYIGKNRWDDLLVTDIILRQFENKTEYKDFVATSGAKEHHIIDDVRFD